MPVDDIAHALDISEVRRESLDGLEGVLLTNAVRSEGRILVNSSHGERRVRFSIAHEIGHFVMERHILSGGMGFSCTSGDMREQRIQARHQKQETEANHFAIALLAPNYKLAPTLAVDPDIRTVMTLASSLNLSLEATMRRYVALSDQPLCAVWTHNGVIRTTARNKAFPWLPLTKGQTLPATSLAQKHCAGNKRGISRMSEANALGWLNKADTELFEQTRVGHKGHALTLLWATLPPDHEDGDDLPELGMPHFR